MQIRDLFEKSIDREINGVVTAGATSEDILFQELDEYVITHELQRHFTTFFENYDRAFDAPTRNIGVWISGFFGSGKSHFLKMLSYLLPNTVVKGKPAADYFRDKLENPMVQAQMDRASSVLTESILFNIDEKAGQLKEAETAKTALLRAFESVFFEHRGFYGEDFKIARLENHIEDLGKTEEFRAVFERISGTPWVNARKKYSFVADDIVDTMQEVLDMSDTAAWNWMDEAKDIAFSIEEFADIVNAYIEKRRAETGKDFRLLFMADEIGQFIGSDVNLMLNLQTLVETLGNTCQGRAWVMVTSQEAIDDIVMVVGNDFSKIQGRFATRLSLSSSSVDEVIKRRVLDKKQAVKPLLEDEYNKQSAVLKNLFSFEGSKSDLIGYTTESDFVDTYPFVGYQFKIMPGIMKEIRRHGTSAQHMSTGERSMLAAFQESAKHIADAKIGALVPFWRFYDALASDFEHGINQVVDRCRRAAEDETNLRVQPIDLAVLKLLYLIRYIDKDVKPTAANIAIMMADSIEADTIALRKEIKEALDRLVVENYVSRQGDRYMFLTDEEQDIAREISNTPIDSAAITERIAALIFGSIFTQTKISRGTNNFSFVRFVDGQQYGSASNGMKLEIITIANELSEVDDAELQLKSSGKALVVLNNDYAGTDYYAALRNSAQIKKYASTRNQSQLPKNTRDIIEEKQREAKINEEEAKSMLEDALGHARCAVDGRMVSISANSPKQVLETALDQLVDAVYTKAAYITEPVEGYNTVVSILSGVHQTSIEGMGGGNERALDEVADYLRLQVFGATTVGDAQRKFQAKPYGWREEDIAGVVAQLLVNQRARLIVSGQVCDVHDSGLVNYLHGKQADKAELKQRKATDANLMKRAREILGDFKDDHLSIPEDEDGLVADIKATLNESLNNCRTLNQTYYAAMRQWPYPGKDVVGRGVHVLTEILEAQRDPEALLDVFVKNEDDLLDFAEDMQEVQRFFDNQKRLVDDAVKVLDLVKEEATYLEGNIEAKIATEEITGILQNEKPYDKIAKLNGLCENLRKAHNVVVEKRRHALLDFAKETLGEVRRYATEGRGEKDLEAAQKVVSKAEQELQVKENAIHAAETATKLDSLKTQLSEWRDRQYVLIDKAISESKVPAHDEPLAIKEVRLDRAKVCPAKLLKTEADVEAYVNDIRAQLLDALSASDAVRLG